jgi:hypothetical protein
MSHFAEIDDSGNVLRVIVADSLEWCQVRLGGTWIQTSYTGEVRKNYAGIGYKYLPDLDAFAPPQPAYNYDIDTDTAHWIFPDGDHIYVPAALSIAEPLSRALYKLIDPSSDGMYCGIIWPPVEGAHALLQLRSTDIIPIALEADPQPLLDVLAIPVADGALTQEEADGIAIAVQAYAGQVVDLVDFIPPSWQPFVMTREQAVQAGYLS